MRLKELAQAILECSEQATSPDEQQALTAPNANINNGPEQEAAQPFVISFLAMPDGNLNVIIEWPDKEDCAPATAAQLLSALCHQISNGVWKGLMVKAIQTHGVNTDQQSTAQAILENWSEMAVEQRKEQLCVDPTNVFRMNEG